MTQSQTLLTIRQARPGDVAALEDILTQTYAGTWRPQMTPQQEVLFDATSDMSEKEMEKVLEMVEWIKTFRK